MEDESKKTVEKETTVEPASTPELNKATEEVKTETVDEPVIIDYKAELEKERNRLKQAEFTIRKLKAKPIVEPVVEPLEEPTMTIDEDELAKKAEEIVNRRLEEFSVDVFEDELNQSSSDANERELIRLKYQTAITKTGFTRQAIRNDLANAKLLANAPRYLKTNKELAETLKSKASQSGNGAVSNQRPSVEQPNNLQKHFTPQDWAFMKSRGWTDEQIKKAIPPQR